MNLPEPTMKTIPRPTESELEILQVLWQRGPSTVRLVNDILNERREVGYTTTLKLLQIMLEKGMVTREDDSRQHTYAPVLNEEQAQSQLLDRFVDFAFGGSAAKLVLSALGKGTATRAELDQIQSLLNQIEPETPAETPADTDGNA